MAGRKRLPTYNPTGKVCQVAADCSFTGSSVGRFSRCGVLRWIFHADSASVASIKCEHQCLLDDRLWVFTYAATILP